MATRLILEVTRDTDWWEDDDPSTVIINFTPEQEQQVIALAREVEERGFNSITIEQPMVWYNGGTFAELKKDNLRAKVVSVYTSLLHIYKTAIDVEGMLKHGGLPYTAWFRLDELNIPSTED